MYQATFRVYDVSGNVAIDAVTVTVKVGTGEQQYLPEYKVKPGEAPPVTVQGDGVVDRYVVMINGGAEIRFWNDVTFMYSTLINDYKFSPERIYLLNYNGANPDGLNMEPCFSGGFIDDLSASHRVISTATEEETESYSSLVDSFVGLVTNAFHRQTRDGFLVDADDDKNGHISIREAFNYAAENDDMDEIPQYDDNGDGIGHPYPIPQGGDGGLGRVTYLESFWGLKLRPITRTQHGNLGQIITYTLRVTNTGNVPDTYDVAAGGYIWPTNAPSVVGLVARGQGVGLVVTVSIPLSATDSATDTAVIRVTSQGDRTQAATATLISVAHALEPPTYDVFLPLILK